MGPLTTWKAPWPHVGTCSSSWSGDSTQRTAACWQSWGTETRHVTAALVPAAHHTNTPPVRYIACGRTQTSVPHTISPLWGICAPYSASVCHVTTNKAARIGLPQSYVNCLHIQWSSNRMYYIAGRRVNAFWNAHSDGLIPVAVCGIGKEVRTWTNTRWLLWHLEVFVESL
jgi:hypothetical protein